MASILKVDKLDPQSGTALEIGTSGDTITVPTGAGLTVVDEVKTNKISPATGTAFALGDSGDTFTVPSGATIVNSGTATGFGGAWTLIKTKTASDSALIDFVDGASDVVFDGTYKMYCITAINVEVANDNVEVWVHTSNDGGSSYETTYDSLDVRGVNWSAVPATYVFTSAIAHVGSVGNAGGKAFNMTLWLPDPADTSTYHTVYGQGTTLDDGGTFRLSAGTGGAHETAEAFDAIKFSLSAGNIATGTFSLYGIAT